MKKFICYLLFIGLHIINYAQADIEGLIEDAESGRDFQQAILADKYFKGEDVTQDYKKALYWFEKSAKQDFALGQIGLGYMYLNGTGVDQDYKKALYWHEKAAIQGFSSSQYLVGILYYQGVGVPKNYEKALYWLEKAAEQGDSEAQFKLGALYVIGKGTPRNLTLAYKWLSLAASDATKNLKATELLDGIEEEMSFQQIAEAQKQASEFKPKGK